MATNLGNECVSGGREDVFDDETNPIGVIRVARSHFDHGPGKLNFGDARLAHEVALGNTDPGTDHTDLSRQRIQCCFNSRRLLLATRLLAHGIDLIRNLFEAPYASLGVHVHLRAAKAVGKCLCEGLA